MLKLLKWIYQLAQQNERQRIEHILINNQRYQQEDVLARQLFGNEFDKLPPKKQENVRFERAVNYRVNQIIEDIVQPNNYEKESYSKLYPKEGK